MSTTQTSTQDRLFSNSIRQPEPLCVLSHGMGQESTALGYMLNEDPDIRRRYAPGRLLTFASATGNEHEETDEHLEYLKAFYVTVGEHFEHITPDQNHHAGTWQDLESFYAAGDRIGSKSYPRACTWNLKIAPFYKKLEAILSADYGVAHGHKQGLYEYVRLTGQKIRVLIGFTAGEADRRIDPAEKVPPWMARCVERVYPLHELGMTREDCQDYIRSLGHPDVYPSLCKFCPWKTPFDLHYQYRFSRRDYHRWVELEANKIRKWADELPPEKNHGVFPGKTLPQALEDSAEEFAHMSDEEMHRRRMTGHGVKSRY